MSSEEYKPKLKTVKVTATMYTFLELTINVPEDMPNWKVRDMARAGYIDGGDLIEPEGSLGDWEWGDVLDEDFNPDEDERFADCPSWLEMPT